jgi:hypothetical protein
MPCLSLLDITLEDIETTVGSPEPVVPTEDDSRLVTGGLLAAYGSSDED